jgi:hypothetical protein
MPLRAHGRVTLEVDGEPVHLAADGAVWTATVRRFRVLRRIAATLPPLPPPFGRPDPTELPATLAARGLSLEVRDARGPLLHLGHAAGARRLRIPFLLDVPHARLAGPLAWVRLLL